MAARPGRNRHICGLYRHKHKMMHSAESSALARSHRKLTLQLALFALGSLLFGFALVPLYDTICDVAGYGSRRNLTQASTTGTDTNAAEAREITVEFVSTMPTAGEWEFRPAVASMKVRTG